VELQVQLPVQRMRAMTEVRVPTLTASTILCSMVVCDCVISPPPPPLAPSALADHPPHRPVCPSIIPSPAVSPLSPPKPNQGLLTWIKSNALARGYTFSQRAGSLRPASILVSPFSTDVEGACSAPPCHVLVFVLV
jgi:hypothetical protein